jgi:hypothetical protein
MLPNSQTSRHPSHRRRVGRRRAAESGQSRAKPEMAVPNKFEPGSSEVVTTSRPSRRWQPDVEHSEVWLEFFGRLNPFRPVVRFTDDLQSRVDPKRRRHKTTPGLRIVPPENANGDPRTALPPSIPVSEAGRLRAKLAQLGWAS